MLRSARLALFLVSFSGLAPSLASAHIKLDVPKARQTPNLKTAPCGASTEATPQALEGWVAGATVTVEFTETIDHPGHYRIALSRTGESAFMDPDGLDDMDTDGIDLLDGIEDKQEGKDRKATVEVTLPDEPCENCVLQLMQIMTDKPTAPFYYQCADVVIAPNPNGGGTGGSDAGASGGGDGAGGGDAAAGGSGETSGGAAGVGGAVNGGASSGGAASGGASTAGGAIDAGGRIASGGSSSAAGGTTTTSGGATGSGDDMSGGGGCSVGGVAPGASLLGVLLGVAGLGVRRLRRRASAT